MAKVGKECMPHAHHRDVLQKQTPELVAVLEEPPADVEEHVMMLYHRLAHIVPTKRKLHRVRYH
ncbi:MAG: hypothetical protein NVSMB49_21750 [Ktedonobacteraceae bacterium]